MTAVCAQLLNYGFFGIGSSVIKEISGKDLKCFPFRKEKGEYNCQNVLTPASKCAGKGWNRELQQELIVWDF